MDSPDDVDATLVAWATRDAEIGRAAAAAAEGPRLEYLTDRCEHLERELAARDATIAGLRTELAHSQRSLTHRLVAKLRAMRASQ